MTGPGSVEDSAGGVSSHSVPPMRTTWEAQISDVGELETAANFARIKWGPTSNRPHDLGTDLWVQVRNPEGEDLRCLVGVQVRTGDSCFDTPDQIDGVAGWWHDGLDARHVQHWLHHGNNHFLVLHNHHTKVSYWEHVNRDTAICTGKRYKVFVPETQTVDEANFEDLLEAALAQPETGPDIEHVGTTGEPLSPEPEQLLRYSLVVPRLVAPYSVGERGEEISAEHGVALLAQGRLPDLKRLANENEEVPDPEQIPQDADWGWQFVGAFWEWSTTDKAGRLTAVFGTAPDANSKAASGVLLSCALLRAGQFGDALTVLNGLVEDDLDPADRGWVLVQRARIRAEAGDVDGSRADAEAALDKLGGLGDEAAKAFDAAARWHLVSLDPLNSDFDIVLGAAENEALRWRIGEVASALSEAQGAQFGSWAEPDSIVIIGQERASPGLFAAEINADLVGGHNEWKARTALRARHRLMGAADSRDEDGELVHGIESLRISGDYQSLESAAKRIHLTGPIEALAAAVNKVPAHGWTPTTAHANFRLLAAAGDLLDIERATEVLRWCAQLAGGDTASFIDQVRPWFWVEYLAIQAIAGLLPAADESAHSEVAELLSQQIDPETTIPDSDIARVFDRLDHSRVSPAARESLWDLAQRDEGSIGASALEWLAANRHEGAQAEAINRAASQHLQALSAMLSADPSLVDENTARLLIEWFEVMAEYRLSAAREHRYTLGGYDGARLLAEFNLRFPQLGRWDTVIELLREPLVDARSKRSTCALLAVRAADLPTSVQAEIALNIDAIAQAAPGFEEHPGVGGIHVMLRIGLETIGSDQAAVEAAQLAFGSQRDREDAALLLGSGQCPANQPVLAALASDRRLSVRRAAATATGRLLSISPSPLTVSLAWKLAEDNGSDLPAALLHGIRQTGQPTPRGTEIALHLRQHPSARIRRMAERIY